jgi:hypothetical protein
MTDASHPRRTVLDVAHLLERSGLALTGGLSAMFVAILEGRVHVAFVETAMPFLAVLIYGSAGFYAGIDLPRGPEKPAARSAHLPAATRVRIQLLSAAGTFLVAVTSGISATVVVLDLAAGPVAAILLGVLWFAGATMQIAAGIMARRPAAGRADRQQQPLT